MCTGLEIAGMIAATTLALILAASSLCVIAVLAVLA